ncbi:type I-C CRISPR-associated protein Cas8c/Csd1 [Desulfonema magnum]|uniref:CRISPR-associated protein Cas8c/Csd1, subtype I-C/DVULG n=1 Tax=Desulfonema magnum TaxID=45655 RepID=A0A975BXX6_9BACT|nr:type I-C CRISPR-associated protein Cas8c/Csd1 [Desulfonema magnum]QTA93781.1 CRISPR-associated protein Cas8c/Csd1, subtype I-C/DVULG [Desulfonema magnum]
MFNELMELGQRLENEGKLLPFGFYEYTKAIKWVVHIWSEPSLKCHIEESEIQKPRPRRGRTGTNTSAHPFADEAAYALGVQNKKGGGIDEDAGKKHDSFQSLLNKISQDNEIKKPALKNAISLIQEILSKGLLKNDSRYKEIYHKDWVSFVMEDGPLIGKHLFEHLEVKRFWSKELGRDKEQKTKNGKSVKGFCSICGQKKSLAKNVPYTKFFSSSSPLHSCNKNAFVSFMEGGNVKNNAHLGQCYACGNTIASTLSYLSSNSLHHKTLIQDKKDGKLNTDSFRNQFAIFWFKESGPIEAEQEGEKTELDPSVQLQNLAMIMEDGVFSAKDESPPPDLKHLENLLKVPWKAEKSALRISENEFYLIVLSPNKGRITVREWFHVPLDHLKDHLKKFLDSQRIITPSGDKLRCFSIPDILKAVEASNLDKPLYKTAAHPNPNLSRGLLRTAYLGDFPPRGLLELAVLCFRNPKIFGKPNTMNIVAAVLKMLLTYNKETYMEMEKLNPERDILAYQCGRLLAILEEAQLRALRWRINTTLVDRFYGAASSSPTSVFGTLLTRATTDHFPKIRKNQLGHKKLSERFTEVQKRIDEIGGFPKVLSLEGQAEFSLGFYHQKADFEAEKLEKKLKREKEKKEEGNG